MKWNEPIGFYDLNEAGAGGKDTTKDLLSDPARRERLLQAVEDIKAGENVVMPDQSLFA